MCSAEVQRSRPFDKEKTTAGNFKPSQKQGGATSDSMQEKDMTQCLQDMSEQLNGERIDRTSPRSIYEMGDLKQEKSNIPPTSVTHSKPVESPTAHALVCLSC